MTTICANCGREIPRSRTFCSKACHNQWQRQYPNSGAFKNQRGENNAHWKGGLAEHPDGYIYEYAPDSPMADKRGYVLQHRLIASQMLGRPLKNGEVVDHIDGNKRNNQRDNLYIHSNAKYHGKRHIKEMARGERGRFIGKVHHG